MVSEFSRALYVVTSNFPFLADGGEVMFIAPEMRRLERERLDVVVVPLNPKGDCVYEGSTLNLDLDLGRSLAKSKLAMVVMFLLGFPFSKFRQFYLSEIMNGYKRCGVKGAIKALWWSCVADTTYRWAKIKCEVGVVGGFYTYWNTAATVGLTMAANDYQGVRVFSRIHGYDLYEERSTPPYLPFRSWLFKEIDRVFAISKAGGVYALSKGLVTDKLSVSYLGTEDPLGLCFPSSDGVFRIVSCSFAVPVKRVELIAKSIIRFAQKNGSLQIEWSHIGKGPLLSKIEAVVNDRPDNLNVVFAGHLQNSQVFDFYRSKCVDVLINLSSSEGLPVSMMEALSFGIPVLATDVGGVSEIVDRQVGALVSSDADEDTVAGALQAFVAMSLAERTAMRNAAREKWCRNFCAETCHSQFAHKLTELLKG